MAIIAHMISVDAQRQIQTDAENAKYS